MGAQLGTSGAMDQPNFTPLIDIVLVVLIIMMVNVPMQIQEMGVKLPSDVETNEPPPPPDDFEQLVIAVYEDGQVALNRRAMTEDVLYYELLRRLRPMKKKNVFIDASPAVSYGDVVHMVDIARRAGAAKVGLAKLKADGPLRILEVAPGTLPKGVTVGVATVVGYVSQRTADEEFSKVLPQINGCYESALRRQRDLSGRFSLTVSIGPDGTQLSEPEIAATNLDDEQLGACILEATKALRFEPLGDPEYTARVLYPLLFSPG